MRALLLISILGACDTQPNTFDPEALCAIASDIANSMDADLSTIDAHPDLIVPPTATLSDASVRATCERLVFVGAEAKGMNRVLWALEARNPEHYQRLSETLVVVDRLSLTFSLTTADVGECMKRGPAAVRAELHDKAVDAHNAIIQTCFR